MIDIFIINMDIETYSNVYREYLFCSLITLFIFYFMEE